MTGPSSKRKANGDTMFIYVNKNCLSAYGKIYRRGEVVELDDEVGAALLGSDDFSVCEMDPVQQETVEQESNDAEEKSAKGAKPGKKRSVPKKAVKEPEEELPAPNPEEAVEG